MLQLKQGSCVSSYGPLAEEQRQTKDNEKDVHG